MKFMPSTRRGLPGKARAVGRKQADAPTAGRPGSAPTPRSPFPALGLPDSSQAPQWSLLGELGAGPWAWQAALAVTQIPAGPGGLGGTERRFIFTRKVLGVDVGTEIISTPGRGTSCPMTKPWAHGGADSAGCGTSCVSPPLSRHSTAPEGPALAGISGSTSHAPPCRAKDTRGTTCSLHCSGEAPSKRSSTGSGKLPKGTARALEHHGGHRHEHGFSCLPGQPNPGVDTIPRDPTGCPVP